MSEDNIDSALISRVVEGDKESFDIIVLKYQNKIANVIGRLVDDPNIVLDLTQDTFVKAYKSLSKFRGESSFYTWLYRIAVNTAKNFTKLKIRRPPDVDIDFVEAESTGQRTKLRDVTSPEHMLLRDEMQKRVILAVNNLPEDLRTSIILREMAGLSYDEIAEVMKCPVGTVRSRIFRARVALDTTIRPLLEQ